MVRNGTNTNQNTQSVSNAAPAFIYSQVKKLKSIIKSTGLVRAKA